MKTMSSRMLVLALVVTALVAVIMPPVQAQTVQIVTEVIGPFTAYKGATDSTNSASAYPIAYTGSAYPEIRGQRPDSMKVWSFSDGDSTLSLAIYFKGMHGRATLSQQSRTRVDSLVSATATSKTQQTLIARTTWDLYDYYNIALLANTWVTAHNSANGPEIYIRIERYFKKP